MEMTELYFNFMELIYLQLDYSTAHAMGLIDVGSFQGHFYNLNRLLFRSRPS